MPSAASSCEQFVLARVTAVERADADPGVLGDGRDRRARIGEEHGTRGLANAAVVPCRLRAAAAQGGSRMLAHGCRTLAEQTIPFK